MLGGDDWNCGVGGERNQAGGIVVGKDLVRQDQRPRFSFEYAGVLPIIGQAKVCGHEQLNARVRIHVGWGDPRGSWGQADSLVRGIGES